MCSCVCGKGAGRTAYDLLLLRDEAQNGTANETGMRDGGAVGLRGRDDRRASDRSESSRAGSAGLADVLGDVPLASAFTTEAGDCRQRGTLAGQVGLPHGRAGGNSGG